MSTVTPELRSEIDDRQHGAAAPQHARRAADRAGALGRDRRRRGYDHRLPAHRASRRPRNRRSGSRSSRSSSGWTTWARSRTASRSACRSSGCSDVEMPERVRNIRVLIAELQRITSHLVWLGTHGLEIGAVSVMMYCFREREQLLNINEMLAGLPHVPELSADRRTARGSADRIPRRGQDVPRCVSRPSSTSTKTC